MYSYLIETTGPFTKEKLKVYKSLEAYNYVCNSYVHTVYHYESGRGFILKAKVNPSQKSADSRRASRVMGGDVQGEWIYKDCPLHMHGWVSIECAVSSFNVVMYLCLLCADWVKFAVTLQLCCSMLKLLVD